jgi:hypothetical protein
MAQLDGGKRPMLVHGIGHQRQRRDVTVVPQPSLDVRCDVSARVYLTNFRGHHAPPAFRLDTAHGRHRTWMAVPHAIAVRHLIKAIGRSDWTNGDRLEQGGISFIY